MAVHLMIDNHTVFRLAVALTFVGGILLLFARYLFGPFPGRRD